MRHGDAACFKEYLRCMGKSCREGLSRHNDATYALPVTDMDIIHRRDDPAHNPLFWVARAIDDGHFPALALYDASQMRLSADSQRAEAKVYEFIRPGQKQDALLGLIEFNIV
jgi:hypothetical protein